MTTNIARKGPDSDTNNAAHFAAAIPTTPSPKVALSKPATYEFVEAGELMEFEGDSSANYQTGPTFSRRFQFQRADGLWAVVNPTYFATTEYRELDCNGRETGRVSEVPDGYELCVERFDVQESTEFVLCSDPSDPGSTEITSSIENDWPLSILPRTHDDAVAESRRRCANEYADNYEHWNGDR